MSELARRGWYSHVEGIDLAGKSTQMRLAREYADANGIPFLQVREPGETELGLELRNQVLHNRGNLLSPRTELFMYMADRSHTLDTVVLPALEQGVSVSHDRAYTSSVAYQSAGGGIAREHVFMLVEQLFPKIYVQPDALAIISISKETYRKRRQAKQESFGLDKIEERDFEYFERVIDEFNRLGEELPHATIVDGEMNPDEVFNVMRPLIFGPEHA